MPSAIPSLVLCLQTIINYDKDKTAIFAMTKELSKCEYNNSEAGFVLDPSILNKEKMDSNLTKLSNIYKCEFPGSKLYSWLLNLKLVVQHYETKSITISNILNSYNMKNKFFNSMIYEIAVNSFYPNVKAKLSQFLETGEIEFDKYFYADLYEELSNVYILRYIDEINLKLTQLNKTELPPNLPIRPFNKIVQSML
jgi:hypothetical protein